MTSPQRYAEIRRLFLTTCARPEADRAHFLDEACGSDGELRQEVEELLAYHTELAPNSFGGHFYLGMGQLRQGQPLNAIQSVRRAIRLNPRGAMLVRWQAPAIYLAGREREAIEIFERARGVNPDDVPARIFLANHYQSAGDHAQARVLVEEVRRVNPDLTVQQIADIAVVRVLGPQHVSTAKENLRRAGLPDKVESAR